MYLITKPPKCQGRKSLVFSSFSGLLRVCVIPSLPCSKQSLSLFSPQLPLVFLGKFNLPFAFDINEQECDFCIKCTNSTAPKTPFKALVNLNYPWKKKHFFIRVPNGKNIYLFCTNCERFFLHSKNRFFIFIFKSIRLHSAFYFDFSLFITNLSFLCIYRFQAHFIRFSPIVFHLLLICTQKQQSFGTSSKAPPQHAAKDTIIKKSSSIPSCIFSQLPRFNKYQNSSRKKSQVCHTYSGFLFYIIKYVKILS